MTYHVAATDATVAGFAEMNFGAVGAGASVVVDDSVDAGCFVSVVVVEAVASASYVVADDFVSASVDLAASESVVVVSLAVVAAWVSVSVVLAA